MSGRPSAMKFHHSAPMMSHVDRAMCVGLPTWHVPRTYGIDPPREWHNFPKGQPTEMSHQWGPLIETGAQSALGNRPSCGGKGPESPVLSGMGMLRTSETGRSGGGNPASGGGE